VKLSAGLEEDLAHLLDEVLPGLWESTDRARVLPMPGDGSDRRFYRIHRGARRMVAVLSPRKEGSKVDENDSYFLIGTHLASRGVPVPRFYWGDPLNGCFLLEDVGDCHFQSLAVRGPSDLEHLYGRALRLLVYLHRHAPEGFDAGFCFDTAVYDPRFVYTRELEYFRTFFLNSLLNLEVPEEELRRDFEDLAEVSGTDERQWVIHRDFQSRNLMVHGGRLRLLDFQGMRYGPPAYDLASLVTDPYVCLPVGIQERLVWEYWKQARRFLGGTRERFWDRYRAVRLSRNVQALAAYAFLGKTKGKNRFLRFVPRAWKQLFAWVKGPCRGRYPRFERRLEQVERQGIPRRVELFRDT